MSITPTQQARPNRPEQSGSSAAMHRRGAGRRMAVTLFTVLAVVLGIATLSIEGTRLRHSALPSRSNPLNDAARARADSVAFLQRYVAANGRVIRTDQGGDTVSEGQGYAMLLAVAVGDRRRFDAAWQWDQQNLQLGDGLFAYHWSGGRVVDQSSAADADLDTAWALVLASQRFGVPAYLTDGLRVASAILANETAVVAGRLELVAGPWARSVPAVVDPGYFAPEAMGALGNVSGDARWFQLVTDSTQVIASPTSGTGPTLVPNWLDLESDGSVQAIGSPSGVGAPSYGLDAQRAPVWFAAGCTTTERAVAADAWPLLKGAADHGARISYNLSGASPAKDVNPLGLVAASAAAGAAGHAPIALALLSRADRQTRRFHTYYGDAWAALGRVLLTTDWLSPCAPIHDKG